jgi:hypothetical protein
MDRFSALLEVHSARQQCASPEVRDATSSVRSSCTSSPSASDMVVRLIGMRSKAMTTVPCPRRCDRRMQRCHEQRGRKCKRGMTRFMMEEVGKTRRNGWLKGRKLPCTFHEGSTDSFFGRKPAFSGRSTTLADSRIVSSTTCASCPSPLLMTGLHALALEPDYCKRRSG